MHAKFDAKSFWKNKIFENNHYSRGLLDPENWWYVLALFEIFEQIWDAVKHSLKRFENPNVLHLICLLIIACNLHAKFQKKNKIKWK